jgi:hypothetical protein
MNTKELSALNLVLDFVERHNKGDEEREVAQAAQDLNAFYFKQAHA